jgi:hypothetical protein
VEEALKSSASLYRLFNKDGILLYVGITTQGSNRLEQHADTKSWWPLVTRVDVQHESRRKYVPRTGDVRWLTKPIRERDEFEAILNEFPVFNIRGVAWRTRLPSNRNTASEILRNRAEIIGAVARLDDAGVQGRLVVLEETEPFVFERAQRIAVRAIRQERTMLPLGRETLVVAEEMYFGDAIDHASVMAACEEFGGNPADYPHVRYQRYPYGGKHRPWLPPDRERRLAAEFQAALAEIKAREATAQKEASP